MNDSLFGGEGGGGVIFEGSFFPTPYINLPTSLEM